MSWCHRVVVFVPGCFLCPSLQAGNDEKNQTWPKAFHAVWEKHFVEFVQMPCPEAAFPCGLAGLGRPPHGIQYYESLEGFQTHCIRMAQRTAEQILSFQRAGCAVAAIVGIEHSPTCAVSYMYTRQGTVRRAGLYMDALMDILSTAGIDITYIGVNRRFPRKAVRALENVISVAGGNDLLREGKV